MKEENPTKIIKTFRAEVVFLITLIGFLGGILGLYYSLVTRVTIIENKQDMLIAKIDKHLDQYAIDHDIIIAIRSKLGI